MVATTKIDTGNKTFIPESNPAMEFAQKFKVKDIEKDDTLLTKEEYFAKLERSLKDISEGRVTRRTSAELKEFLGL
jgi:hypothetical protein